MTVRKKSILPEILKREKELKAIQKEKEKVVIAAKKTIGSLPTDQTTETTTKHESWEKKFHAGLLDAANDVRFYFLKDEFLDNFKSLYKKHFSDLERYGITSYKFLDYARESFERYKSIKNYLPLEPMDKKSYEYSLGSIETLMGKLAEKFKN